MFERMVLKVCWGSVFDNSSPSFDSPSNSTYIYNYIYIIIYTYDIYIYIYYIYRYICLMILFLHHLVAQIQPYFFFSSQEILAWVLDTSFCRYTCSIWYYYCTNDLWLSLLIQKPIFWHRRLAVGLPFFVSFGSSSLLRLPSPLWVSPFLRWFQGLPKGPQVLGCKRSKCFWWIILI